MDGNEWKWEGNCVRGCHGILDEITVISGLTEHAKTDCNINSDNEEQFPLDACDIHISKFGRTGSNVWAYLLPNAHCWELCTVCGLIDEEISNMRRELDKYGIQMPAFSKIGGMLANEVSSQHLLRHLVL